MEENKVTLETQLELLDEVAEAAISLNPYFQWAKIVVTDDQPNLNKQRIPIDEFENIIRTGVHTPIKMTPAELSKSHDDAMGSIIGTITQLVQEQNRIIAIAALWKRERTDDINMLKDMYTKGLPPNVSWEVTFHDSELDDDGVESLKNVALNGLAVVARPAYGGRTPFIAMASEIEEDDNVEELEQAKQRITELEAELAEIKAKSETAEAELVELRTFKNDVEKEKMAEEKLAAIKAKFTESGLEKDDEYFTSNKDMLLGLADEALDFMVQELVSFKPAEASAKNIKLPKFANTNTEKLTPAELGRKLREQSAKK